MTPPHNTTVLDIEAGERQRFPPPGHCIYCGATNTKLTDEHIVPYALTGDAVIFENASCGRCARIINTYEGPVLQKAVGRQRQQLDTPTRRPQNRPDTIPHHFNLLAPDGTIVETVERQLDWRTSILSHTGWRAPAPGILAGRAPSAALLGKEWCYVDRSKLDQVLDQVARETGHQGPIAYHVGDVHQASLLRFIAKTAHAFAVAKLGGDAFGPLLLDLILNRSDRLNHLIGGPDHPELQGDTNAFEMWLGVAEQDDEAFLMAWLRMFGLLGGPAYVAVVGTLSPDQLVATREAMAV